MPINFNIEEYKHKRRMILDIRDVREKIISESNAERSQIQLSESFKTLHLEEEDKEIFSEVNGLLLKNIYITELDLVNAFSSSEDFEDEVLLWILEELYFEEPERSIYILQNILFCERKNFLKHELNEKYGIKIRDHIAKIDDVVRISAIYDLIDAMIFRVLSIALNNFILVAKEFNFQKP